MICYGLVDWLIRYPMTAVVTVVFTSCPTRGGQQRNQFSVKQEVNRRDCVGKYPVHRIAKRHRNTEKHSEIPQSIELQKSSHMFLFTYGSFSVILCFAVFRSAFRYFGAFWQFYELGIYPRSRGDLYVFIYLLFYKFKGCNTGLHV